MLRLACLFAILALPMFSANTPAQGLPNSSYVAASSGWSGGWNGGWNSDRNNFGWSGASNSSKAWQLGVTGKNTEIGVVIESVAPNSAAARSGLTAGDLVVCVNGDQVGLVGSKIFDIAPLLNQHADTVGNVRLLVQYRRTGQLRTIPVQLSAEQGGLSGNLIVQNGSVPPNSVVTIQLVNETRPHFVVRNGEQAFRSSAISQGSIPFTINFDPNYIAASDRYSLRAFITYNNNTIYETAQPTYVLTQGNPTTAQLVLTPKSFSFSGQPAGGVVTASYVGYDNISAQVTSAYQKYLGRNPTPMEIAAWHSVPDPEYRMSRLPNELMATQEYFDRCGHNNVAWLERVFSEVIGHVPTAYEQQQWMARYAEVRYSRTEVLNQMSMVARRS
ncbi:YbaY family lipoprotein [Novipirellula artificiosorum]|nr:YbaY family lipoprotein [Novipirellula artificiosorum]